VPDVPVALVVASSPALPPGEALAELLAAVVGDASGDGAMDESDALGDASIPLADADAVAAPLLPLLPAGEELPEPDVPHAASTSASTLNNMNTRFICNSFVSFGRIWLLYDTFGMRQIANYSVRHKQPGTKNKKQAGRWSSCPASERSCRERTC